MPSIYRILILRYFAILHHVMTTTHVLVNPKKLKLLPKSLNYTPFIPQKEFHL